MPERSFDRSSESFELPPRTPVPPAANVAPLSESARQALAAAAVALRSATTAAATSRRSSAAITLRTTAGALQQAVCDCVAELMAAGESPERVLVSVKRAAIDAGVPERASAADGADGALMDRIVRWCIEAYYREG